MPVKIPPHPTKPNRWELTLENPGDYDAYAGFGLRGTLLLSFYTHIKRIDVEDEASYPRRVTVSQRRLGEMAARLAVEPSKQAQLPYYEGKFEKLQANASRLELVFSALLGQHEEGMHAVLRMNQDQAIPVQEGNAHEERQKRLWSKP